MSKNTGACKFRKVDVDQFDEDKYQDELTEEQVEQGPNVSEVTNLLGSYPWLKRKNKGEKNYTFFISTFIVVL